MSVWTALQLLVAVKHLLNKEAPFVKLTKQLRKMAILKFPLIFGILHDLCPFLDLINDLAFLRFDHSGVAFHDFLALPFLIPSHSLRLDVLHVSEYLVVLLLD